MIISRKGLIKKMRVSKNKLYRKMLICPRLNINCDGIKIRCVYVSNETGNGWMIENLNNDNKTMWHKELMIKQVVELITEKYEEINITWSRTF